MRRNFMKSLVLGAAGMAGLTVGGQLASAKMVDKTSTPTEVYKATPEKKRKAGKQKISINPLTGGLVMPPAYPGQFGLSPKEYGMRYGNGGSKRSNRNRYAHNAKVKRRNAV